MHNIKRWGCRRLMSRGSPLSLFPTDNPNSDLQRVHSQWCKAATIFTATATTPPRRSCCRDTLRFTDHRCTCADCITEPSMAGTSSNSATPAIPSDGLCLLPHSLSFSLSLCVFPLCVDHVIGPCLSRNAKVCTPRSTARWSYWFNTRWHWLHWSLIGPFFLIENFYANIYLGIKPSVIEFWHIRARQSSRISRIQIGGEECHYATLDLPMCVSLIVQRVRYKQRCRELDINKDVIVLMI
jgi:hypothetical protein